MISDKTSAKKRSAPEQTFLNNKENKLKERTFWKETDRNYSSSHEGGILNDLKLSIEVVLILWRWSHFADNPSYSRFESNKKITSVIFQAQQINVFVLVSPDSLPQEVLSVQLESQSLLTSEFIRW